MSTLSRREFLKIAGAAGTYSAIGPLIGCKQSGSSIGRVVIIGGGFGGSTCAKYIKMFDPRIEVTLVEREKKFVTCPFSNTVVGGLHSLKWISHEYNRMRDKYGITIKHDSATNIDPEKKEAILASGEILKYDRLVVTPGIDFRWDTIEGYDEQVSKVIPHAWQAGSQTFTLRRQLEEMEDGGVVLIAAPANPYRCPPGPYERASMVAYYLKQRKPKSKILILDAKDKFSKQSLFMQGWGKLYPGMIEWVRHKDWGATARLDVKNKTLFNAFGDSYKGSVVNIIPPQIAGEIARASGLANKDGWCPVNQTTFESTIHKDIHVIGDSAIAGAMPKSGFAANSQGKVCAAAIVSFLNGEPMPEPSYVNTCYSLLSPDYGISVAAVYRIKQEQIVKVENSGGVSPMDADDDFRKREAKYAIGWYQSIISDMFT